MNTLIKSLFLIASIFTAVAVARVAQAEDKPHKVIAYYFHGDVRCSSCRRIEEWSANAIKANFAKELESGELEWKVVNVDETQNEHFNTDYQLYTKSLVIVDFRDGKQTKWKNLDGVWQRLSDQEAFSKYVDAEVAGYLKEG